LTLIGPRYNKEPAMGSFFAWSIDPTSVLPGMVGLPRSLAQRLGFDLADALAGDVELLADLFQRLVRGRLLDFLQPCPPIVAVEQ